MERCRRWKRRSGAESSSSTRSPVLPTKPVRTTSALVGKAYSAAGQAAACLHTMSLLQAYQAELLTDLDEGELTPSCPSPFDVLRGPVCQPCHLACFRTQRSISGFTWKRSGLGVCAPSEEAFRAISSDASCRFTVSGHRSVRTYTYTYCVLCEQ